MKILVVDDREINRKLLRVTLQAEGMETLEAEDGVEALKILAEHAADCIITDILMPNMDGYRLCQRVRADAKLKDIPIIIYTATYQAPSDEQLALKSGADRYLKKPSSAKDIMAAIRSLGRGAARRSSSLPEAEIVKEYSELLVRKLEEKNLELQEQAEKLQESEEKLRQLVENDQQVFFLTDRESGALLYVSPVYEKIWGRSCESLYKDPDSWMEPLHPKDRERIRAKMGQGFLGELEYRILRPDGQVRWIMARVVPLKNVSGKSPRVCGISFDVTDRKVYELWAAAEHAVALILSTAPSLKEAAPRIIEAICEALDWEAGALWRLDRKSKTLRCLEIWRAPGTDAQEFEEAVRQATFASGVGLPGRVWESGKPALAAEAGLRGAFAIPVTLDQDFLGVLEFFSAAIRPPDDKILRMLENVAARVSQYIQRREAEEALRQSEERARQAQQLEAANKELEAFSYSVSHDLRAPLRGIDGFSQALLDGYAGRLDAKGLGYLDHIRQGCRRMGKLIDDLLKLAHVIRQEMQIQETDLSALARSEMEQLKKLEPGRSVAFSAPPELRVAGDPGLLRAALANLLGNAWKFTGKQKDAKIEFGAAKKHGDLVFFVKDNGAGFDMAYADRLFGAFQRLHAQEEFPGTGIGLATVQRIVRRHGGLIWAEGAVGQGAAFYFTLGAKGCVPVASPAPSVGQSQLDDSRKSGYP